MHEAGAVAGALERVIHDWPETHRGGCLELQIRDATRAEAESVAFYASAILADHGFEDTTFSVTTDAVSCVLCGAPAEPTPADPQCDDCGAPLPRLSGPAVVCRDASSTSVQELPCA